ncbi:hypothetical protein [Chitinophaga varians]|uniref:hypothetical protein n=1 Tax=Chitinophaga varians TaxID=2202339 RepID=UPI00165EDE47|nr:hypothetical protein [Chitinophaga varians]MBC9913908.1 hypothetical protein [Chitinophaga varians]
MPITDTEKYKDAPGYQQVYSDKTIEHFSNNGRIVRIIPTADRCFHTFTIKPDGRPFLVHRSLDYFNPLLILGFTAFIAVILAQPKPLYAGIVIAILSLAIWGFVREARAAARKLKPIIMVDRQGITLDSGNYPWDTIVNTFIVIALIEKRRTPRSKSGDDFLVLTLINQKTVIYPLDKVAGKAFELATTITYFSNNNSLSCPS